MRVMNIVTWGSRSSVVCLWTWAFSSLPISISCGTEISVMLAMASAARTLWVRDSNPRRRGRRHFIRTMTAEASVCSCEFNAVHEDNGRDIDPQQKDDDGRDRALDEGEPRIAREVPREAAEGKTPEHSGQRRADPDVAEPRLRVRNEIEDEADTENQDDGRRVAEQ